MSRVQVCVKVNMSLSPQQWVQQCLAKANENLDESAELVKDKAMQLCPVGTPETARKKGYEGGTLRDSHEIMEDSYGPYQPVRYVYNDVHYARWVHDGTYKMPDRPWFRTAVWSTQHDVTAIMSRM